MASNHDDPRKAVNQIKSITDICPLLWSAAEHAAYCYVQDTFNLQSQHLGPEKHPANFVFESWKGLK